MLESKNKKLMWMPSQTKTSFSFEAAVDSNCIIIIIAKCARGASSQEARTFKCPREKSAGASRGACRGKTLTLPVKISHFQDVAESTTVKY